MMMRSFKTLTVRAIPVCVVLLAWTGAACAHAFLSHAIPLVGSTVPSAPPVLTLDYTEGVETAFSTVVVKNAAGVRVDNNDLHNAPGNQKRILLGLQSLKPGAYTVEWHVTSVDTHKTEGTFTFSVGP
jgi:methionine-rich copper-binding protein CopC